ncbi:MAG: transporter substrate-binding domain-containing protein [Lachnospiraceae bacterium]|nr:transporter substrate-binding domain-containing protein [Lachnospiraceae bacterium]
MKKLLALMLTGVMVLSMAGCGSSSSTETTTETEETTDEEEAEVEEETEEVEEAEEAEEAADADSDLAYVQEKGTLVVGITDFEPMDYKDEDGNWIGFDADMATAFAESLGVAVEFVEIDWDNKILELDGKTIDCVWNGMTLTDEVMSAMDCSNAYSSNSQVVVLAADVAEDYADVESLADLSFAVESGSAGEAAAEDNGLSYTSVSNQANALMEVAAGTSDAAIIDLLMAEAMVGEGTSYEDLTTGVVLVDEEYGVGFRQGSDLVEMLNEFFAESYADGSMVEIATTYGIENSIIAQ